MFWGDFTGGGHSNFYDFTWSRGTGRTPEEGTPSRPPPVEIRNAGRFLRRFVEEGDVPFWRLEPRDDLGSRTGGVGPPPFVLARPGEAYVIYLISGGALRLNLEKEKGQFRARWFNPRNGKFGASFRLRGGKMQELKTPGAGDWALLVSAGSDGSPDG
jgi:hypothetical protein